MWQDASLGCVCVCGKMSCRIVDVHVDVYGNIMRGVVCVKVCGKMLACLCIWQDASSCVYGKMLCVYLCVSGKMLDAHLRQPGALACVCVLCATYLVITFRRASPNFSCPITCVSCVDI